VIKPEFLDPVKVEQVDAKNWRLLAELRYDSAVAKARIIVPAGFVTDFASVPRIPVAFWLVGDTAHAAAVIHDWLYTTGLFPKDVADDILFEAMVAAGTPAAWRRRLIYWGVKYGGAKAWNEHRKADHESPSRS
jgi:hypothetical protein